MKLSFLKLRNYLSNKLNTFSCSKQDKLEHVELGLIKERIKQIEDARAITNRLDRHCAIRVLYHRNVIKRDELTIEELDFIKEWDQLDYEYKAAAIEAAYEERINSGDFYG